MKILIVTPGITNFPANMENPNSYVTAKAETVTDHSAHLVAALSQKGMDVHVAIPNYLSIDEDKHISLIEEEKCIYKKGGVPDDHIHLINDNRFIHLSRSEPSGINDNASIAFAFQREVLKRIVPKVNPQLIHCNDWLTGLIPAATRNKRIPCLLTLHNMNTHDATLSHIERSGISAKNFWTRLFFKKMPNTYEEAKANNPVDLLASAIFGAHFIHTCSPTFLEEIVADRHNFIPGNIVAEITNKKQAGCAIGIPLPVNPEWVPQFAKHKYSAESPATGKLANKTELQLRCKLDQIDSAPVFFWPSRLDDHQKGCHLMTDILYETVDRFWGDNLQVVVIANGVYKKHFVDIVRMHSLSRRVAVVPFDQELSRLAYAASDFVLLPSLFEPCGLVAMTGLIYGSLPVAHDTGGLHDTIKPLRLDLNAGNGFLFQEHSPQALRRAVELSMNFYSLPADKKTQQISRIMKESRDVSNIDRVADEYIRMYKEMLDRPLINTF